MLWNRQTIEGESPVDQGINVKYSRAAYKLFEVKGEPSSWLSIACLAIVNSTVKETMKSK
jgi:hypothetical protein